MMPCVRLAVLVAVALWLPTTARATKPRPFDAGFLASRHVDASGDQRLKVAGPFFEMAESTQGLHMVAFRPFYSAVQHPAQEVEREDYLWPLGSWRKIRKEEQSRILTFVSFKHGEEGPEGRYRFWLLPFYFQGRDASGETYRAVFPFGGTLRDFLGRDEIKFVLFPLRSTSTLNDLETSNWLWPFISKTTGDGVERKRVFPFYARSYREGAYDKRSVMWPFWNDVEYFYPGSAGKGFILFPITGHMKLENQESWWALPPFFRYTKADNAMQLMAPWPFIQRVQKDSLNKFYIWPLWGHKQVGHRELDFYLWPLFWKESVVRGEEELNRFMAVPLYTQSSQGVPGEPPSKRHVKLWPLFSYQRMGDDARFQTLDLWPIADNAQVARNWAPFWTLYSSVRHDDAVDRELLWGLHRDEKRGSESRFWSLFPLWDWTREPDRTSWKVLKGLIGRTRVDTNTRWRVLFFMTFGDEMKKETQP